MVSHTGVTAIKPRKTAVVDPHRGEFIEPAEAVRT